MNIKKSQRAFVGVTLTTVIGIALVLVVYAATLATFTGNEVVVGGSLSGNVYYCLTESGTYTSSVTVTNPSDAWYASVTTGANGYTGPGSISWQLEKKAIDGSGWDPVGSAVSTTGISLDGTVQTFYTSGTSSAGNHNWSAGVAGVAGSYRVVATISSA